MQTRLAVLLLGIAAANAFVSPGGPFFGRGRSSSVAARGSALALRGPRECVRGPPLCISMSGNVQPEGEKEGSKRARFTEKMRRVKAFTIDVGLTPITAKLSRSWAKWYLTNEGTPKERENWEGKTAIVTGGSGGIGQQAALGLAARGFKVILAVRNVDKGKKARQEIQAAYPNAEISIKQLDLSSLKSVRSFAESFGDKDLSVLVLNAGYGGGGEGGLTEDGLEWYFQVNHLGHFLLTHLLWPNLEASKGDSRVVSVSSVMHWKAGKVMPADFKDLDDWVKIPTGAGGEYRRSKLFNVMFSNFLSKIQLQAGGGKCSVKAHAVNPGFVYSDIWRHETSDLKRKAYSAYCKTTDQGAVGIVRAATEDKYGQETGLYLVDGKPARSSTLSHDEKLAQWLFRTSERLTGIKEGGFGGGLSGAFLKGTQAPAYTPPAWTPPSNTWTPPSNIWTPPSNTPPAPAPVSAPAPVQPAYTVAQGASVQPATSKPAAQVATQPMAVQSVVAVQPVGFEVVGGQPVVQPVTFQASTIAPAVQSVAQAVAAPPKPVQVATPKPVEVPRTPAPSSPSPASAQNNDAEIQALKSMKEVTVTASSKFDEIAKAASERLEKLQSGAQAA